MRVLSTQIHKRGVAQPGSAPPWGGGGRRFKSSRPDQSGYSFAPFLATGFLPPSAADACGWLTHDIFVISANAEIINAVIPAKAGIQVLNGIVRAARDTQQRYAGGSAPALWDPCARAIPGPRPAGSLRLYKFDPVEFIFARAKKAACRGSATHKYASAQPTQNLEHRCSNTHNGVEFAHKTGANIHSLDPLSRG